MLRLDIENQIALIKVLSLIKFSGLLALVFSLSLAIIFLVRTKLLSVEDERTVGAVLAQAFFVSLVFGVLASVAGFLTANSRESAVSDVLPAALAFIGGAALFVLDKGYERFILAGVAVVSFASMMMFGAAIGSFERQKAEAQLRSPTVLRRAADVEFAVTKYRQLLGLDKIEDQP